MDKDQRQQIDRENRAEVQRARTGLSNRDWAIVFGALVIAIAILGFIYTSENSGVGTADLEPAAGVSTSAPSTYDEPAAMDRSTENPNPNPAEQPATE